MKKKTSRFDRLIFFAAFLFTVQFFSAQASALEIYRPENFGNMNIVPCMIRVTDMDGNDASSSIISISYSWYYEINKKKGKWLHRYWNGCFTGGTVVHLDMKSGSYKISVYTPVKDQSEYASLTRQDWISNEFVYKTGSPALNVIFVSPVANDNGFYTGAWHIDYRAPKFYIYTKPKME